MCMELRMWDTCQSLCLEIRSESDLNLCFFKRITIRQIYDCLLFNVQLDAILSLHIWFIRRKKEKKSFISNNAPKKVLQENFCNSQGFEIDFGWVSTTRCQKGSVRFACSNNRHKRERVEFHARLSLRFLPQFCTVHTWEGSKGKLKKFHAQSAKLKEETNFCLLFSFCNRFPTIRFQWLRQFKIHSCTAYVSSPRPAKDRRWLSTCSPFPHRIHLVGVKVSNSSLELLCK